MYSVTPKTYLQHVRVDRAIEHVLLGEKVEFIPLDVGYRSRKNMNRAFAQVAGLPPSFVRRLPDSDVQALRGRIREAIHIAPRSRYRARQN